MAKRRTHPYFAGRRITTRRRGNGGMTIPLAIIAGFMPLGIRAYNGYKANGTVGLGDGITSGLTGYSVFSKTFEWKALVQGLLPILAGLLVHKYVGGQLGLNRALSGAKVPLLRI